MIPLHGNPINKPKHGTNTVHNAVFQGKCNRVSHQWGIQKTRAPEVWRQGFTGQGIVVAIIDSGVNGNHRALQRNHREGGWNDRMGRTTIPTDEDGHGTHVAGTVVGTTENIGMAPDAQWIACRACNRIGDRTQCSDQALRECAQWAIEQGAHVSVNSWGTHEDGARGWYEKVLQAYRAFWVVPVFSIGNAGNHLCGNPSYPGHRYFLFESHLHMLVIKVMHDLNYFFL